MVMKEYQCPRCQRRGVWPQQSPAPTCGGCAFFDRVRVVMEWAPTAMTFALKGTGWTPKGGSRAS